MRAYGMSLGAVLELQESRFWALFQQIDRLEAEDDMRALQLSRASQADQKAFKDYSDQLVKRIRGAEAAIAPPVAERDKDATKRLKELAKKTRGG